MNGIEKITQRIDAEAQAEIDRILADARAEAEKIMAGARAQAEAEAKDLAVKKEKAANQQEERLVSVAQMESRKTILAAKQEMVERTYARALEKLCTMPDEQYTAVLAELLVRASTTGQEEVVFSPEDRERVGKAAVARANELLAKRETPEVSNDSKVVALLNKVAAGVSAVTKSGDQLTVSEETRPIRGGFVLKNKNVEVNCTFDVLVRLQKAETAGAVAKRLFPEA